MGSGPGEAPVSGGGEGIFGPLPPVSPFFCVVPCTWTRCQGRQSPHMAEGACIFAETMQYSCHTSTKEKSALILLKLSELRISSIFRVICFLIYLTSLNYLSLEKKKWRGWFIKIWIFQWELSCLRTSSIMFYWGKKYWTLCVGWSSNP